jgi:Ca-activated chloride channel family protein
MLFHALFRLLSPLPAFLAALFLCLTGVSSVYAQQPNEAAPSGSTIRVNVARVDIGVTVTDSRGHFVPGLRQKDFKVFDNGAERPIDSFASSDGAAQIVFLLESAAEDVLLAKLGKSPFAAADKLVQDIAPSDRVAVVTYSEHAEVVSEFTSDKTATRLALKGLNSDLAHGKAGSNSINLSSALAETLDWLAGMPGNKTIIVLSSGMDTSPMEIWYSTEQKLRTSPVRILGVSIFGDFRQPPKYRKLSPDEREDLAIVKKGIFETDRNFEALAVATGGRAYLPKNDKEFRRAYEEIAQLVRCEYAIEFVPSTEDGELHSIQIKLKRAGYNLDYRKGYLAPPGALPVVQ